MKYSAHTFPIKGHWIGCLFSCLLLIGCGGPSASKYAQKFCTCSSEFSKADIQLKAGTISQSKFNELQTAHDACMGEENPLEGLKNKPEELAQFKAEFLLEINKQCPETARNMNMTY